jgi:hypothetical protein
MMPSGLGEPTLMTWLGMTWSDEDIALLRALAVENVTSPQWRSGSSGRRPQFVGERRR